ncbi:MAG: DNA-binding CsgD family transcriptional regulator [Paracoccaceae bacterium]|jgi:DNA-binding CsgD family transcriptional regulator
MGQMYQRIGDCLKRIGHDGFLLAFLDIIADLDVDQLMIFAIDDNGARCLASRHFQRSNLGGQLAEKYLDGWYLKDPLLVDLQQVPEGEVALCRMDDFAARIPSDYRQVFFTDPGLVNKYALLAAGKSQRLMVNLYQSNSAAQMIDPDLLGVIGRLAILHFESARQTEIPPPLAALSDRERAVCLGILAGKKAEIIAGDLELAQSTVVTYRKRAYEKLGVTSRAALFSICAMGQGVG